MIECPCCGFPSHNGEWRCDECGKDLVDTDGDSRTDVEAAREERDEHLGL